MQAEYDSLSTAFKKKFGEEKRTFDKN